MAEVLRGSCDPSSGPGVLGREEGGGPDLVGVWGRGREEEVVSGRERERVKVAPRVKLPVGMVRLVVVG